MRTCKGPRIRVFTCPYIRGSDRVGISWHEKYLKRNRLHVWWYRKVPWQWCKHGGDCKISCGDLCYLQCLFLLSNNGAFGDCFSLLSLLGAGIERPWERGCPFVSAQCPILLALISVVTALSNQGVFYNPLDGMLVLNRLGLLPALNSSVLQEKSVLPKITEHIAMTQARARTWIARDALTIRPLWLTFYHTEVYLMVVWQRYKLQLLYHHSLGFYGDFS